LVYFEQNIQLSREKNSRLRKAQNKGIISRNSRASTAAETPYNEPLSPNKSRTINLTFLEPGKDELG
jgi:hypothetical protein